MSLLALGSLQRDHTRLQGSDLSLQGRDLSNRDRGCGQQKSRHEGGCISQRLHDHMCAY